MNRVLIFVGGVVAGASGLCWVIEKYTAGIQWYISAKPDPNNLPKLSTTIWDDDEPGKIAEKIYLFTDSDELGEVIGHLQEYYDLDMEVKK